MRHFQHILELYWRFGFTIRVYLAAYCRGIDVFTLYYLFLTADTPCLNFCVNVSKTPCYCVLERYLGEVFANKCEGFKFKNNQFYP